MDTKVRILIGENDFNWGVQCAKQLDSSRFDILVIERNALEILSKIQTCRPDIILLPAQMKHISAIGMMEIVRYLEGYHPEFIVTHSQHDPCLEQTILKYGAYCYLEKPFAYSLVYDYILEIADLKKSKAVFSFHSYEEIVSHILWEMKIPTSIKGFHYLRKSILLSLSDRTLLESITKGLYPAVAIEYQTNTINVERSIHNAISRAYQNCDSDIFQKYFGILSHKPSNGQFISMIVDRLSIQYKNSDLA